VDRYYDPIGMLLQIINPRRDGDTKSMKEGNTDQH
jgi:hypothetical protein